VISTRSRYGLRALLDLAEHTNGDPVYLRNIAEREKISPRYLENIFTRLRAAGILTSLKGRRGGFSFGRELSRISLFDIIKTLEDTVFFTECVDVPDACEKSDDCFSRKVWVSLDQSLKKIFSAVTLESLLIKKSGKTPESIPLK